MKLGCKLVCLLCIAWIIIVTVLDFTECRPVRANWDIEIRKDPGSECLDFIGVMLGTSTANCIIDFLTLALPIHEIMKLHTSIRQKVKISCVFVLGGM
jgi:hypothetical protein